MIYQKNADFWQAIDTLLSSGKIVIDRPKGSSHPKFPHLVYEVDYGYIENTASMDGEEIDVWRGSLPTDEANAVVCTVDLIKRDSEIKILVGCTKKEMEAIRRFHSRSQFMKCLLVRR